MKSTSGMPVRLKYEKLGKVRWIGHRDVARAMERAIWATSIEWVRRVR